MTDADAKQLSRQTPRQCYFLKRKHGVELSQAEARDYAAIQEYCGVDEQGIIAPLFRSSQEMFSLSINRYMPPVEGISKVEKLAES